MAIIDYGTLVINGVVFSFEGRVKIEAGKRTRMPHPQINGVMVVSTDIESARSKISVPTRVTPASDSTFDDLYTLEDNILITFRAKAFTGCFLEVIPEREDVEIVDYVFFGNPEV